MSLLALSAAATVLVLAGAGALARRRHRSPSPRPLSPSAKAELAVGAVVVHEGEDRVIHSSLVFREGREPVATLHFEAGNAPDSRCIAAFPRPSTTVAWLAAREVELPSEPPLGLELDGDLLERAWLRTVDVESRGHPLAFARPVRLACFRGGANRIALVVQAASGTRLYAGIEFEARELDVLGKPERNDAPL